MNKIYKVSLLLLCALVAGTASFAQSFKKGSLLLSISEGGANVKYHTSDVLGGQGMVNDGNVGGDRDPLLIEYGLTKHWGIGVSSGADIFSVDPRKYYGFTNATNNIKVITTDFALEANYHFLSSYLVDLSAFGSAGFATVNFKTTIGDQSLKYDAVGNVFRIGTKARYYIVKRFGVMGMFSLYSAKCAPKGSGSDIAGARYSTSVTGYALEFGLCYRVLR